MVNEPSKIEDEDEVSEIEVGDPDLSLSEFVGEGAPAEGTEGPDDDASHEPVVIDVAADDQPEAEAEGY